MRMQWDKGTERMLNGWLQSQQKLWGNWWEMMAGSTQNGHPGAVSGAALGEQTAMFNPMVEIWSSMAEGWRTYLQQSLTAYAPQMQDAVKLSMEQFLASQSHTQQVLRMSIEAWQGIMATASSPAEWQQGLATYLQTLREQLMAGFHVGSMTQNSTELWQIYTQEMQKLTQPWLNLWLQGPQLGMAATPRQGTSALADVTTLYWDAFNQTLGRMANMPSIGLLREFNEKVNRGFLYWQDNQRVNAEYQQLLVNTLVSAFEAFMQKLLEMAQAGQRIDSQSKLTSLWVEIADEQFLQLFHSEHYAEVQSRFVNSSMALRRQQRELVEVLLRMNNLPTQSALDEAHHNIFLLRKEIKALKKAVHALGAATAGAPDRQPETVVPAPKPVSARPPKATRSRRAKPSTPPPAVDGIAPDEAATTTQADPAELVTGEAVIQEGA